ncbi:hypothetical protein GGI25_005391 [Coemansia spiralis]|uniref:Uncharacterized protein n=2 Tax=Coemansia TaxID=4863 RepID=A0A9W8G2C0_9FUNG|nr:hypothetical protein BX070DRAFT_254644 [Coemansia spiralis]KAJ1991225.1 hypothetical protein EDC05_003587 [Coemansia umbellata]KAJ2621195.1 hypothetical protein GGI26_004364 [Coemansia sp. RSA 1358]KAJ2671700.1 hypothetical protein GGI25_005391 [Coemansia spiralis]
MALAAGAAVVLPTVGAFGTMAYYAKHPLNEDGTQKQRRSSSISSADSEFIVDDDPSEFSSFSSAPSIFDAHMARRKSRQGSSPQVMSMPIKPDHKLLEDPELQVWRDRYKWGRDYGMNFAHNDR